MDRTPLIWIAAGIVIAVVSFLFVDDYNSYFGLISAVLHRNVGPVPYRYILAVAVLVIFYGVFLWARQSSKPDN